MPRQTNVPDEIILREFRAGKTASQITRELTEQGHKITREGARLKGMKFELQGLVRVVKGKAGRKPSSQPKVEKPTGFTWSAIQEALFQTFSQARRVEALEQENYELRNKYGLLKEQYEASQRRDAETFKGELEYRLRQQQGELPQALLPSKKTKHNPDLTYHIRYHLDHPTEPIAISIPLHYISEGTFYFN